ncbi:MAG: TIGR04255 family protein [Chloroflexota bacterium]|nr:TIGR04255 family protein [Chloroflexota bacterium]
MFEIARPCRYRLTDAPLAQALVQVRFPLVAHFQELSGIAGIQDHLSELLPYLQGQQVQQMTITLAPGTETPPPTMTTMVWRFTGDDQWTLALEPGAASLFVGDEYRGIEDFADRFFQVLSALYETRRVRRCDRLGLRYLNIVEPPPGDERAWARWFKQELIGWVGAGILGPNTRLHSSLAQTQISVPPVDSFAVAPADVQAMVRHGVLPAGTEIPLESGSPRMVEQEAYVIDLDLFIQAPQRFDPETLIKQFQSLHAQIDAFFHWSLTEEGARNFGMGEL